jgi:hypothetical protein
MYENGDILSENNYEYNFFVKGHYTLFFKKSVYAIILSPALFLFIFKYIDSFDCPEKDIWILRE